MTKESDQLINQSQIVLSKVDTDLGHLITDLKLLVEVYAKALGILKGELEKKEETNKKNKQKEE